MTCYAPLRAYEGEARDDGKVNVVWHRKNSWKGKELYLPCGKCIGCKLMKASQWAIRCMHEASLFNDNSFITLTYEKVPENGSINVRDWQDFIRELKRGENKKIRYFMCGEYGELKKRPHYHAILFGYDFDDREFIGYSDSGEEMFKSEKLNKVWNKGSCTVQDVNRKSASYVARYSTKKVYGEFQKDYYEGLKPPFTCMSRKPGIGSGWYEKFKGDIFPLDEFIDEDGVRLAVPRFYDERLKKEDPGLFSSIKEKRKNRKKNLTPLWSNGRMILVDEEDSFRLRAKEKFLESRTKNLNRSFERVI